MSGCGLLLCVLITLAVAVAVHARKHTFVDDKVQHYLSRFGYLPQSDVETGNLRTDEQLVEAILDLQRFGNINQTGVIDEQTRQLLMRPRCGLPDWTESSARRRKRYTLQGQTWPHTNLTWSLRSRNPANLDQNAVRQELSRALDVWAQHSKLTFRELDSDDADILVYFWKGYHNDGYAFDGKGQILAHAFFPGTGRGGDVHFDEEEAWLTHDVGENEDGTSLFAVAAHEFGHSLGLSHSSVVGALMYPWYQGIKPNELPEDDRHGIQQMYGSKQSKLWGQIPPKYQPITTTTTERTRYYDRNNDRYPNNYPERPPKKYPSRRYPNYNPDTFPTNNVPTQYPDWPRHRPEKHPERPRQHPYVPRRDFPEWSPRGGNPNRPKERPDWPMERPDAPPPVVPRYRPTTTTTTTTTTEVPWERPTRPTRPTERPTIARRHRPTVRHKHVHHRPRPPPDQCNTSYDAIAVIRREVFIFKNEYLWRIGDKGLYEGYPAQIIRMWNDLPSNLSHVDAVYERHDRKIVFFIGKLYYVYVRNRVEHGYPKPLTHLGLPESLEHIDGAMVWGHNGKTYLYSGTMYWRMDEETGRVELDYPRDIAEVWHGVAYNIDTVFQWKDGKTYFFKGLGFWKFNDMRMSVENIQQSLSAPFWMDCGTTDDELRPAERPLIAEFPFNAAAGPNPLRPIHIWIFTLLAYALFMT